jgi:hypothetical protein
MPLQAEAQKQELCEFSCALSNAAYRSQPEYDKRQPLRKVQRDPYKLQG